MTQDTELDFRKAESFELGMKRAVRIMRPLNAAWRFGGFAKNHSAKLTGAGPKNRN
jgi:hypothetical protein